MYFHGAIGSPLSRTPKLDAAITGSGIRYVVVERPGFGGSDPHPGRRISDFAADVEQLADRLGFGRFSVVGVSAGAPYALACAWAMPNRITAAGAVSPIPPGLPPHRSPGTHLRFRLPLIALARRPRAVERLVNGGLRLMRRHPALLRALMRSGASSSDRTALDGCDTPDSAAQRFLLATERGPRPMIEDYLTCCRDWGFDPSETHGRVHLWHGARDSVIPAANVRELAERLPNCHARFGPEDGHFFFSSRIGEILPPLVEERGTGARVGLAA